MQVDLQKILSVSGQPGLYKYLSQARQGIVVESLKDGKRSCLSSAAKVSSLSDITVYTESDDILLKDILLKIKEKQNGETGLAHKSENEAYTKFYSEILPDYDKDRFMPSHMRKIMDWYNLLQSKDMLDFKSNEEDSKEE